MPWDKPPHPDGRAAVAWMRHALRGRSPPRRTTGVPRLQTEAPRLPLAEGRAALQGGPHGSDRQDS